MKLKKGEKKKKTYEVLCHYELHDIQWNVTSQ